MRALDLIAAERQRQIEVEGYTSEHDAQHAGDLARAAACYALPSYRRVGGSVPAGWPWGAADWKPTPDDRVRELAKAGALIVAEIERLQRQASLVAPVDQEGQQQ